VGSLLDVRYTTINVDATPEFASKAIHNEFPVLETAQGAIIWEAQAIAKHFSRTNKSFYGVNDYESKFIILNCSFLS